MPETNFSNSESTDKNLKLTASWPQDCPAFAAAADKTETCRMVVWEKVWENYREVQWDEVDCPSAKNRAVSTSLSTFPY